MISLDREFSRSPCSHDDAIMVRGWPDLIATAGFVRARGDADENQADQAVACPRARFADGTTAAKAVREDGAELAGSYQFAADVSGGAYPSGYLVAVGATSGGVNPAKLKVSDVLLCPYLSDATADSVYQQLRALRGLP